MLEVIKWGGSPVIVGLVYSEAVDGVQRTSLTATNTNHFCRAKKLTCRRMFKSVIYYLVLIYICQRSQDFNLYIRDTKRG